MFVKYIINIVVNNAPRITILRRSSTSGQCDLHCKIKETLLIRDSKSALNENVGSENLLFIISHRM